jgi:acetylornithine deacetylase
MSMSQPASVEALLARMVGFNTVNSSVSGDPFTELKLAEFLETIAIGYGLTTRRLPVAGRSHNLLVTWRTAAAGAPWLLFDSHMDTVRIDGMTIDPLAAGIRDGRMYGRGTCDTKGTGAAMLWALGEYARSDRQPNNIAILFSVDEEFGMSGVRSFVANDYDSLGFRPRGVIVGEPTLLRPVVAHNGCVRWRITTTGVAVHSSDPSRGVSAIRKMVDVIEAVERQYIPKLAGHHALTGRAQCSINIIRGGQQINVIPDECTIDLDRRVVPGENSDTVLPAVQAVLDELTAADSSLQVTQSPIFSCPPLCPSADPSFLAIVQRVLGDMGLPTDAEGVPYATDGGDLAVTGLPIVVLGPGDVAQAHTKDEWLALEQLRGGVELYRRLMEAEVGPPV